MPLDAGHRLDDDRYGCVRRVVQEFGDRHGVEVGVGHHERGAREEVGRQPNKENEKIRIGSIGR